MYRVFVITGLIITLLVSCSSEPSLQKYFVEKSKAKNFVTLDIAPNFINTDSLKLSGEEQSALKSLNKLNILIFQNDSLNESLYDTERNNVNNLLKGEQYEQLMKMGSGNQGVAVYTLGEEEHIDEFVLFMHEQENGFGVVRILGDDMNPNNIMTIIGLMQKGNLNLEQLKPLQDIMKT